MDPELDSCPHYEENFDASSVKASFDDIPLCPVPLTQLSTSSSGRRSFNHRVGDVDMSVQTHELIGLLPASQKNFSVYWRRYAEFTNSTYTNGSIPEKTFLNDLTISEFLFHLKKDSISPNPNTKKVACCALNSALGLHGLPNINLFPHHYPKTMTVIKQWKVELKIKPYVVKKSFSLELEHVNSILDYFPRNVLEMQQQAGSINAIFTSLRSEDQHRMTNQSVVKVMKTGTACRHIKIYLNKTKNDITGTGPASGRTFLIPCLCDQDDGTGKHLEFRKALRKDPNGRCIDPCPYQVLLSYYVRDLFFHLKFLLTIVDTL